MAENKDNSSKWKHNQRATEFESKWLYLSNGYDQRVRKRKPFDRKMVEQQKYHWLLWHMGAVV